MTLKPATLFSGPSEGAVAFGDIPADVTTLVLVYVNQTVVARHAFTADKPLDDAAIQPILADVNKVVAASK